MQPLDHPCSQLLPQLPSVFFFFSFNLQHPFLTFSQSIQIPCPSSFHRASIEVREKASAAAAGHSFLQGRYRGAGSSLHEWAPLLQLHSAPPLPLLFRRLYFVRSKGADKKEGISFFSLCTSHSCTGIPKVSANELLVGKEAGLWKKKSFDLCGFPLFPSMECLVFFKPTVEVHLFCVCPRCNIQEQGGGAQQLKFYWITANYVAQSGKKQVSSQYSGW